MLTITPTHSTASRPFCWIALVLLSISVCLQAAAPIDMEGRDVLFTVTSDGILSASGSVQTRVVPGPTLSVPLNLSRQQAEQCYGLLVPGVNTAKVSIGATPLNRKPVVRSDGALFEIMNYRLHEGPLSISITIPGQTSSLIGTTMFSLQSQAEEDAFGQLFGEPVQKAARRAVARAGQADYDVLWYDCSWTPTMTSRYITGSMTMGAQSLSSTLQVVILDFGGDSDNMYIDSVDQGPSTPALAYTRDTVNYKLNITLPSPVAQGNKFVVRIAYHGTPSPIAGRWEVPYNTETHGSGTPVVYTFSEPYGARTWWPCKDIPGDKATTTTQRITVPSGYEVVSNGKLTSKTPSGGNVTWVWQNHHPVSTYLVSMCVSNYTYSNATYTSRDSLTTMPISHAIYPENVGVEGNGAAGTLQVMNFFANTFGEYPFVDEKYFTASHNSGSGMEHQTNTSMPDGDVQDGMQRRNVHELSHHWFGDKITCATFDEIWLNEGFGTYCEALWDEYHSGSAGYWSRVNSWSPGNTYPIIPAEACDLDFSTEYHKGGWVLHMLRHIIGDTAMFQALRTWASATPAVAYGTATTADFKAVAEAASGQDLDWFFDEWLYYAGRPSYYYKAASHRTGGINYLDLTVGQTQTGTYYAMPIDIQMTDSSGATQTIVFNNAALATDTQSINVGSFVPVSITFDPDNWVLENNRSLSINTCGLPPVSAGTYYSRTLTASSGRTPYTWSIASGSLPPGMTLTTSSNNGVLAGTCSTPGTYTFTVQVRDSRSTPVIRTTPLTLEVRATGVDEWKMYY